VLVEVFGKEQAYHAKPLFLKNRTLTITCTNSVMAQEIRLHQVEIIEKVNQKIGKKEVDSIRYLL
jgi:predicted nucleic acid-binding Zn ribbon protein